MWDKENDYKTVCIQREVQMQVARGAHTCGIHWQNVHCSNSNLITWSGLTWVVQIRGLALPPPAFMIWLEIECQSESHQPCAAATASDMSHQNLENTVLGLLWTRARPDGPGHWDLSSDHLTAWAYHDWCSHQQSAYCESLRKTMILALENPCESPFAKPCESLRNLANPCEILRNHICQFAQKLAKACKIIFAKACKA